MFQPNLLDRARILITGGGSGLGAEMALRFAQLGAMPIICGRREPMLKESTDRIKAETGIDAQMHVCDLRQPQAVAAMFDAIWSDGPLDALVNNAAATFIAQTERLSARAADAILAPTLHGAMYCTLEAGRRWIDSNRPGVVLSILSTSVRTGRAFTVPSSMGKAAIQAMTRSLAVEWGPKGIRLVAIAPGPFPTAGANRQLMPQQRAQTSPPAARNPLGRVGEALELTNLAAYLLSPQAAYITGETIAIDGGAHLRSSGAEDLLQWTQADWDSHRSG